MRKSKIGEGNREYWRWVGGSAILFRGSRKVSPKGWHLSRDLKEMKESAMQIHGIGEFQAGEKSNSKVG